MGIGLLDTSVFTGKFLRDDLAALTYQALGTDLKDGSTYLLDSLIKSGAVDAAAAKPTTDKIEAYRALNASSAASAQGLDASIDASMKMTVGIKGTSGGTAMDMSQKMDASVKGDIQVVLEKTPQMAMNLAVTLSDGETTQTEEMQYWLKDGVTYVRSGEEAYQMDSGVDMESLQALLEQSSGRSGAAMLPFLESIRVESSGENSVYTLKLNSAFSGMINGLLGAVMDTMGAGVDMDMAMSLEDSVITYTVGKDGALKNAALTMTLGASMDASEGADTMSVRFTVDMDMTMDVKAMGGDVTITFPDFSGFEKIIGGADGPTGIMGTVVPA